MTNKVRVIGYFTNNVREEFGSIPDDYLSNEKDLPVELISLLKSNGWSDAEGNLWWSEDFQPEPMKGKDGNVYLMLSDYDLKFHDRTSERLTAATKLLYS